MAAWNSLPNAPQRFAPQHQARPSVLIAQLCRSPTEIDAADNPLTVLGVDAPDVFPMPSCPSSFLPQQRTAPAATPHV